MKKIFSMSIIMLGLLMISQNANAGKRRIVAVNQITSLWTRVYVYPFVGETALCTSWPGISMTKANYQFNGGDVYYADIEIADDKLNEVKFIFNQNYDGKANETWAMGPYDLTSESKFFYIFNSDNPDSEGRGLSAVDVDYYWVNTSDNSSQKLEGEKGVYSVEQEPLNDKYLILAPNYALYNDNKNIISNAWDCLVFRPNDSGNYWINDFKLFNESLKFGTGGEWYFDGSLTHKSEITFNVFEMTFSVKPFFEKSVASGDAYASFSFDKAVEVPNGVNVYSLTKSSNTSVKLNQENISALAANQGVLISGGGKFYPATSTAETPANNILVASGSTGIAVTTSDYILAGDGDELGFYHPSAAGTLGAYKAYIPASNFNGNSSKLSFVIDDATAINEVSKISSDNSYYTLQGVKVNNAQKGVFIHNGKKVVLK